MKSKKLSEVIIKTFKTNGFVLLEPDVLLDSDYIIERSGEKFRSSMLTFDREDGITMCLRPDLTVASCISFLQKKTSSKIYYSGQAYRRSGDKSANFINDQINSAIKQGAKKMIEESKFNYPKEHKNYMPPQVLTNVDHRMKFMMEETFGPCVGTVSYTHLRAHET